VPAKCKEGWECKVCGKKYTTISPNPDPTKFQTHGFTSILSTGERLCKEGDAEKWKAHEAWRLAFKAKLKGSKG